MFAIYRNIQRNIYKTSKRGICITKDDNITSRLKYITGVLKNKDKDYSDTIHVDKKELNIYCDDLEKEKNQLFKKMTQDGRWNEYMGITGDFSSHTYF
jgi:hypothetical protein